MAKIYLRQFRLAFSACRPFYWKVKETRDLRYIYLNKLDKACWQHEIGYRDFKEQPRRTVSVKVLYAYKY